MNIPGYLACRGQMEMMQGELAGIRQHAREWQGQAEAAQLAASDRERQAIQDSSEAHRLTLLMSRLLGAAGVAGSSHRDINDLMHAMNVRAPLSSSEMLSQFKICHDKSYRHIQQSGLTCHAPRIICSRSSIVQYKRTDARLLLSSSSCQRYAHGARKSA